MIDERKCREAVRSGNVERVKMQLSGRSAINLNGVQHGIVPMMTWIDSGGWELSDCAVHSLIADYRLHSFVPGRAYQQAVHHPSAGEGERQPQHPVPWSVSARHRGGQR